MSYMTGIALANKYRANGAEEANEILSEGIRQRDEAIRQRDELIKELRTKLIVAQADARGRKAQADSLMEMHQDSPLLVTTSQRFLDATMKSKAKTKIRLIYESAFDKLASDLGIRNPVDSRLN